MHLWQSTVLTHVQGGGDCGPARVHTLSVHIQEDQGTHMCLGMSGEAACLHAVCLCVAHTRS